MLIPFLHHQPKIHSSAFIAPGASLIGRVTIGKDASVWFGSVLRADINRIVIGEATNIQDGSILHVDRDAPCLISHHVHVGHHVNLHGCIVETGALIGIGSIVLSRAHIGREAIIGAGSVVLEGTKIPPRVLAVGAPARVVRSITAKEIAYIRGWVTKYVKLAKLYKQQRCC